MCRISARCAGTASSLTWKGDAGMNPVDQVISTDGECFQKAKANGEPTFTLRAQDISAPIVVDQWAAMNELALGKNHPKIVGARAIANLMREWPNRRQAD